MTIPFQRKPHRFDCIGADFNNPVDRIPEGYYPVLENIRPEGDGSLSPRPGQGNGLALVGGQTPVHTLKRFQDTSSGSLVETIIAGVGTHCAICAVNLSGPSDKDSGYSGDPLSIAIHQPRESVKPYAYVADRSRMQKFDVAGAKKQIGLPPPTVVPTAAIAAPSYRVVEEFDDNTLFTLGGTAAGAKADSTRVDSATRSVTKILYDVGSTGWASIRPNSMADIGRGMRLTIDSGGGAPETVVVQDVYRGSQQTTIASLRYENGAGPSFVWIHLTTPVAELEPGSLVLIDAAGLAEYALVLAVEMTRDGFTSFRCATTNIFAGGETVQAFASFRAYFTATHANGNNLFSRSVQFTTSGAGTAILQRVVTLDLSSIASGLPTKPDDYVHLSIFADDPSKVTEVKALADCGVNANYGQENYFFHSLRQNDLTPVTKNTQTALANAQTRYQRNLITPRNIINDSGDIGPGDSTDIPEQSDPLNPTNIPPQDGSPGSDQQIDAGQNQYAEILFRVGDLLAPESGRVGSNQSRGLADIVAIQVIVIATAAVTIRVDGWWIGSGYGPDVAENSPRIYRYRSRDSSTGAVSNWSPAMRGGVRPYRQKVNVTVKSIVDAECDKIDFAVFGGAMQGWHFAAAVDNPDHTGTTDVTFPDTYAAIDLEFQQALTEGNDHYQLWPIKSTPVSGQGSGAGTMFTLISGSIALSTAPGTNIRIGGQNFTLYKVHTTSRIELVESIGVKTVVNWECSAPLLQAQPLYGLTRPFHGFMFAWGDKLSPWNVYYTNGDDPDGTQDDHFFNIGAEIVQHIVVLEDGNRCIAFTAENIYSIEPALTLSKSGGGLFVYRQIHGGIGLPFRFFICNDGGSRVAFGSRAGIFELGPSGIRNLTDDHLYKWFPHERSAGVAVNGFNPPDFAQTLRLRLGYVDDELHFDYVDTPSGASRTMVYRESGKAGGWRPYIYAAPAQIHYAEEGDGITSALIGGTDGKVYRIGRASADAAGVAIVAKFRTGCEDDDDPASSKHVGDILFDCDRDGVNITLTPGFDNHSATLAPSTISTLSGRQQYRIDINSGDGRDARNASIEVSASVTTQRPTFFLWQPSWQPISETTLLRAPNYALVGGEGVKFARGIWIHADTFNVARTANLKYTNDDGTVATLAITGIQHAVLEERFYPFASGIYLTSSKLLATDAATWNLLNYRLEAEPAPPLSTQPTPWGKPFPDADYQSYVEGFKIDIDTAGAAVRLQIQVDGNVVQTTVQTGAHGGTITANGRSVIARSFDVPFITHLIRVVPLDPCRIFLEPQGGKLEWVAEPEPELAQMWWPQQTDFGMPGFKILGDGYISVRSNDEIHLEYEIDGVTYAATFYDGSTNTAGNRRRLRFRMPHGAKGKVARPKCYANTAAGRVSVFEKEFCQFVKEWGNEGAWQPARLIGDEHYRQGARI